MMKKKRWLVFALIWFVAIGALAILPGAKEYALPNENSGLPEDAPSIVADRVLHQSFDTGEGMPLFGVVYDEDGLTTEQLNAFDEQLQKEEEALSPYGIEFPKPMDEKKRAAFVSEDETTYFVPFTLTEHEEWDVHAQVTALQEAVVVDGLEITWTGPGGIASDAIGLFSDANVTLLLATVGLIFVLLLVIYRAPLLTLIPLVAAGIVYFVTDKVIGGLASASLFVTENQALSIMTILLFAVVTDYSLLIFSRFREELHRHESVDEAMKETMRHVREPIFFSGSTIMLGMATLFFSLYEPYRNFAPVFAIAALVMLLAGLTLIPALFALFGRVAFWPFVPKVGSIVQEKQNIWRRLANRVTRRPVQFALPLLLILGFGAWKMTTMETSFDLIESFPEDASSRIGYERLGDAFSEGSLAPGTLLLNRDGEWTEEALNDWMSKLNDVEGVERVNPTSHPLAEGDPEPAKLSVTFEGNPYSHDALDAVLTLRDQATDEVEVLVAGESAKQADLREINTRDTWIVAIAMTILIGAMLLIQTRSLVAPILMVGSILLSYAATFGFSLYLFEALYDKEAIGYRLPMYTFVFLVALGVDYSIMLVARIREALKEHSFEEAVRVGLEKTGNVISSAGLILAATFLVLATMPIEELKLFGMMMALGILIDTFVVRPLLLPALLVILGEKWSFWPRRPRS